jgi:hypothetical protein
MRRLNLRTVLEDLVRSGNDEERILARAALARLGELASDGALADRASIEQHLLGLLTRLEAVERSAPRAEGLPPEPDDRRLFSAVERVLDLAPILQTDTGFDRFCRVLQAALGRRPPRLWRELVDHFRDDERAREILVALRAVLLLAGQAASSGEGGGA